MELPEKVSPDELADKIMVELRDIFEQRGFSSVSKLLFAYRDECKECIKELMDS